MLAVDLIAFGRLIYCHSLRKKGLRQIPGLHRLTNYWKALKKIQLIKEFIKYLT